MFRVETTSDDCQGISLGSLSVLSTRALDVRIRCISVYLLWMNLAMDPVSIEPVLSPLSMAMGTGPVVMAVLIILIVLSVFTWAITIAKILELRRAGKDTAEFSSLFWESRNLTRIDDSTKRLTASPLTQLFNAGYRELSHILQSNRENSSKMNVGVEMKTIERILRRAELEENLKLRRGTTFLATVASAAPFIGLFGTVWGIMTAFHGLSTEQTASIQAVAPGISEALIATAVGLAAAIPAAIAYNYFAYYIRNLKESMERFSAEFLTLAERHFSS